MNVHQSIQSLDYGINPLDPTETFLGIADLLSENPASTADGSFKQYQYVNLGGSDAQKFQYARVDDIYQLTCHPGPCSPPPLQAVGPTPLLPGGTNGGDFSWSPFQKLTGLWLGQSMADNPDPVIGYTRYAHVDANDQPFPLQATSLLSFNNPNAVNWLDTPFGPIETIDSTHSVLPTAYVAPPTGLVGSGVSNPPPAGSYSSDPLGPPIDFGQWTVSGGTITASYNPGTTGISGDGFLQRVIVVGGQTYIQTVVADDGATGDPNAAPFTGSGSGAALGFSDENFVKVGVTDPSQRGVSDRMHIEKQDLAYLTVPAALMPGDGGQFVYTSLLNTGWANGSPIAPVLQLNQHILVQDDKVNQLYNTSLDESFSMKAGATEADRDISMVSVVGTQENAQSTYPFNDPIVCGLLGGTVTGSNCVVAASGFNYPVVFRSNIKSGVFQTTTHTTGDPLLFDINGNPGQNIAWAPGDAVQATYVGALYQTPDIFGDQSISANAYTNLTTGQRAEYNYVSYGPYPLGAVVLPESYSAINTFGGLLTPPPPWSYVYPAPPP
jgi:hypothetical protein